MIAIPLTKKASWHNPPWVTLALIILNVFIFVSFQHHDNEQWAAAEGFYFESGLARLEADIYQGYLESGHRAPNGEGVPDSAAPERERLAYVHHQIMQADDFIQSLEKGQVIPDSDPRLTQWRQLRREYDQRLEQVVPVRYGFRPARPRLVSWFSSMFLHGGWGHLIGNMVFLWLVGCLIEYGCRHLIFPVIYLLGGMAATGFFWLLNMQSTIPAIGASGAIAGIMGAFTVFYGIKKVNIFLNLGFYFNYLKFPAILLLPLWMGNELFQLLFDEGSSVAYAAHFGGLGGGALMAWGVSRIPGLLDREAFEAAWEDKVGPLVERALRHMGNLEYAEARPLLEQALAHAPEDTAIWKHLYAIDRQDPASNRFHKTVKHMLSIYCRQPSGYAEACSLFLEYLQNARPPKLSADLYIRISYALADLGKSGEAERIILALLKKKPQLPDLPTALLKLARSFQRQNEADKARQCVQLLHKYYPAANETRLAMQKCH